MIGLIWKDLLCLRKSAPAYLFVVGLYAFFVFAGLWDGTTLAAVIVMLLSMLPYGCFAYDNLAKWELYGLTLPLKRSRIVLARYLLVILMLLAAVALMLVLGAAFAALGGIASWPAYWFSMISMLGMGTLFNAILLPLLYRFGAERARILFFGVLGAMIAVVLMLLSVVDVAAGLSALEEPGALSLFPLTGGVLAAGTVLLAGSYALSVKIYQKREF